MTRPGRASVKPVWIGAVALTVAGAGLLNRVIAPARPAAPDPRGIELFAMSSLQKVLPDTKQLPGATPPPLTAALARNETEAVQLIVRSSTPLRQVWLSPRPLTRSDGQATLPADAVRWSRVQFVTTRRPAYEVEHVGRWPDPLVGTEPFAIERGTPQPIWITVTTPSDTPPGRYAGAIILHAAGRANVAVPLEVTVWDFALPDVPTFRTAIDVYANRIEQAYTKQFPAWGWRLAARGIGVLQLTRQVEELLLRYRLAPMVHVVPDQPAALDALRSLGPISAFNVGTRGGSDDNRWPSGAALDALIPTYRRYAETLTAAGLLDRHYIYAYDEPEPGDPRVADVVGMLHRADPRLRTLVTLNAPLDVETHRDWLRDIDIVCLRNVTYDPGQAQRLRQMGKTVWLYTSGPTPPFPALVIDYPATATRIVPWMCWREGIAGLLHWSSTFWTTDPYRHPNNTPWGQNGNGLLIYPGPDGPRPSIRLELLRDGVEDYEYLTLLAHQVRRLRATPRAAATEAALTRADRLLAVEGLVTSMREYDRDPQHLLAARAEIAELIQQLQAVP